MTPKRKKLFLFGAVVGLCLIACFVNSLSLAFRGTEAQVKLFKCKGTMAFVRAALMQYCATNHAIPYVPGAPGEELYCHIDFQGRHRACTSAAPDQDHGGYQMLNASPSTWVALLSDLDRVPVLWCGASHHLKCDTRLCLTIGPALDPDSITYEVLSEEALHDLLDPVNTALQAMGLEPADLDVQGRQDYKAIAAPYQTEAR